MGFRLPKTLKIEKKNYKNRKEVHFCAFRKKIFFSFEN